MCGLDKVTDLQSSRVWGVRPELNLLSLKCSLCSSRHQDIPEPAPVPVRFRHSMCLWQTQVMVLVFRAFWN